MGQRLFAGERVCTPVVEGLFYPEDRKNLEDQTHSWGLKKNTGSRARIIMALHGAWSLAGKIAGAAFAAAAGGGRSPWKSQSVIILGPVHGDSYDGLYLSDSAFFDAPLRGKLPVDQEFSAELESSCTLFEMNGIPHLTEHFLEVLLPLVKFCCGGTSGKWLPEGQNPDRGSLFRRDREQGETVCYGALSFE